MHYGTPVRFFRQKNAAGRLREIRCSEPGATLRVERSGLAGRIAKRGRFGMERFR
jgi:hypothetical protein